MESFAGLFWISILETIDFFLQISDRENCLDDYFFFLCQFKDSQSRFITSLLLLSLVYFII